MGQLGAGRARLSSPDLAAAWSRLHHGIDPRGNWLLWWWLRAMWLLARPFAWLPPLAITAAGAVLAIVAALVHLAWLAVILVLASVFCDGLDGAVAVLSNQASSVGAFADKVADRIADTAFVLVLWRLGAPLAFVLVTLVVVLAVEMVRELLGGRALATITVGERPSRVVCVVIACVCAELSSARWPLTVCTGVLAGLSVIAVGQLRAAVRAS